MMWNTAQLMTYGELMYTELIVHIPELGEQLPDEKYHNTPSYRKDTRNDNE
jgi:hypothetical protein